MPFRNTSKTSADFAIIFIYLDESKILSPVLSIDNCLMDNFYVKFATDRKRNLG